MSPYGESPLAFGSPFGRSQSSQDDDELMDDEGMLDYGNEEEEHYGYGDDEHDGDEMFLMDEEVIKIQDSGSIKFVASLRLL